MKLWWALRNSPGGLAMPHLPQATAKPGVASASTSSGDLFQDALEYQAPEPLPEARPPSPQALAASSSWPVLLAPCEHSHRGAPALPPGGLPANTGEAIPFETPLFSGTATVFLRGVAGAAPDLFQGQRRRTLVALQGRFSEACGYDDIVTGQEFGRAARLPPAWIVDNVLLTVARAVSPSMEVGPSAAPYMLMPAVAGCNALHVAAPGDEPSPAGPPVEDMRLVEPRLADPATGAALPAEARRAFYSDPANRVGAAATFDPGMVYTFWSYQHLVDASSYRLDFVFRYDLSRHLDGQPLQLMMKDRKRGQYLYRLLMWHERLLPDAARRAAAQREGPR